jgi:hypothetical protein
MNLIISRTAKGTKEYPFHRHSDYEISFCLDCVGTLRTEKKQYSFSTGNIIVVPPGTLHSSVSDTSLDCIYIRGEFNLLFDANEPVVLRDNANGDGRKLAMLIYDNRFSNREYLLSLCDAYIHFIITNMQFEDGIIVQLKSLAFSNDLTRFLKIHGSDGILYTTSDEKKVAVEKINGETTYYEVEELEGGYAHHAGGDVGIMKQFIDYVEKGVASKNITDIADSVMGHEVGFLAEESRLNNGKTLFLKGY